MNVENHGCVFPSSGVHRGEASAPDVGRSSGQVSKSVSNAVERKSMAQFSVLTATDA